MTFTGFPNLPVELQAKILLLAIHDDDRTFTASETMRPNDDPYSEPIRGWEVRHPPLPAVIRAVPGTLTTAIKLGIIKPMLHTAFSAESLFVIATDCLEIRSKITANGGPPSTVLFFGIHRPIDFSLINHVSFGILDLRYHTRWVRENVKSLPNVKTILFAKDIILLPSMTKVTDHIDIEFQPGSKPFTYLLKPQIKLPVSGDIVHGLSGIMQLTQGFVPFAQISSVSNAWMTIES